jgi:hypothetical protein
VTLLSSNNSLGNENMNNLDSNTAALNSATAIEAIGTEATLFGVNQIDYEFKQILLEAIQCKGSNAQDLADKDLGKIVRELVTAYIAHDVEDLV